jgi:hypothetical protein
MIRIVFVLAMICLCTVCSGQQISMYRTFGGVRFEYNKEDTVVVSARQVAEILSIDPQVSAEFKLARTNSTVASIFGFAGGFLLAFPVGTAIAGGDPEWGLAAGGAACILASIPFSRAFYKRAASAIDNYNSKQGKTGFLQPELQWKGTGISLRWRL